jgi:hypothetical protein
MDQSMYLMVGTHGTEKSHLVPAFKVLEPSVQAVGHRVKPLEVLEPSVRAIGHRVKSP